MLKIFRMFFAYLNTGMEVSVQEIGDNLLCSLSFNFQAFLFSSEEINNLKAGFHLPDNLMEERGTK